MNKLLSAALINLTAYKDNLRNILSYIGSNCKLMAIVKADAYGHGSIEIANAAQQMGVNNFGVSSLSEALELRNNGILGEILILGQILPEELDVVAKHRLSIAVSNYSFLEYLRLFGNKNIQVHIKIDTGLSRYGFYMHHEHDVALMIEVIRKIATDKNFLLSGVFTHFASSEKQDSLYHSQLSIFEKLLVGLKQENIDYGLAHCANSTAVVLDHTSHFDMVRVGLLSYGINIAHVKSIVVRPVMEVYGTIVEVKTIFKGDTVGYGATYIADDTMQIAIVNLGYADGISRQLSSCGSFLVNNGLAKIVGRVSMDAVCIDVTNFNVQLHDIAWFVGRNNVSIQTISDISNKLGTIEYEIMCMIGKRVKRVYYEEKYGDIYE